MFKKEASNWSQQEDKGVENRFHHDNQKDKMETLYSEASQNLINEKTVYAVNQSMNVVHTNVDGRILYGNQNIFDLTLYKPEELLGNNPRIFNAGYHSKEFYKEMWDTILSGQIWRGEVKNKRKDGKIIWVRMIITPIIDQLGKPYQFVALKEDITEKKEMEFQLAQKEKQLSALTKNSQDIIGIMDMSGTITYMNPAFERLLGYSLTESLGTNIFHYFEKTDQNSESEILQRIANSPYEAVKHQAHLMKKDRTMCWCDCIFSNYIEDPHIEGIVFNLRDVTIEKDAIDLINYYAYYDYLTGLPNRRQFENKLDKAIEEAKINNQTFGILLVDIDGFKQVNDTYGHEIGDQLLIITAKKLSTLLDDKGFVGRLGGDEFSIIIPDIITVDYLNEMAETLVQLISRPIIIENCHIHITASIGVTLYPTGGTDIRMLLRNADLAMYQAKQQGKNQFIFSNSKQTV